MRALVILLFVAGCGRVGFEPIADAPPTCGPAYLPVAGLSSLYRRSTVKATWFEAQADCESDGGHLVVVDTLAENTFVDDQLEGSPIWLGLTDHVTEGTMRWVNDAPLGFDDFKPGEPNNSNGEDCTELQTDGWNDTGCKRFESDYVCECDRVPIADTFCDTDQPADCDECGSMCTLNCSNQVCGGGGPAAN